MLISRKFFSKKVGIPNIITATKPAKGFYVVDSVLAMRDGWVQHVVAWTRNKHIAQVVVNGLGDNGDDYIILDERGMVV
jgi:hypothetical protein